MEKFREALKHSDTVKAVLTGIGETIFLSEEVSKYIEELERLTKIGEATEKAFMQEAPELTFEPITKIYIRSIEELLEWAESEENNE